MAQKSVVVESRAFGADAVRWHAGGALPVICFALVRLIPPRRSGIKRVLGILSDRPVSSMVGGGRCAELTVDPSFGYTFCYQGPVGAAVASVEGRSGASLRGYRRPR